ncbi:MAG TPA: hypothetical protein VEW46_01105 [Pyrinomonadaceae bacterium]|nr:hypothetical protein [Pyrinomonadaceae bacterium]
MIFKERLTTNRKLVALTLFTLSVSVIAALVTVQCHSAGFTRSTFVVPPTTNDHDNARAPATKRQWFVSAAGSPTGQGTQSSPWDLATALAQGPDHTRIRPGDIVWLRAGRYTGTFKSTLNGNENEPIIVRAFPGERVIIDKATVNLEKQPALKVRGSWVWFWGIEIMNSSPNRQRNSPLTGRDEPWRGSGADVYAPHVKFINMIFHDNGHGIWDKQDMTEVHGCLFFYNGTNKREHAMYIGNSVGTKYITDNIIFAQGGYGLLAHSDSLSSSQKGLHLEGNVSFNNGMITNDDQKTGNLQVGGVSGVSAERIVLKSNYIYNTTTNATHKNNGIRLGYQDQANKDVTMLDNYVVSKTPLLIWWWQAVNFEGNTIYSTGDDLLELKRPAGGVSSNYRWDFNKYFAPAPSFSNDNQTLSFRDWRQLTRLDSHSQIAGTSRPNGVRIFVRPNRYEAGRANIVIYNWDLKDHVAVDVSSALPVGSSFEIRDAQNYFAEPVLRGTYKGGPLLLPMKLTAVHAPVGNVERIPRHTPPEFGVFVLQTTKKRLSRLRE